jgi:hypothetical protein
MTNNDLNKMFFTNTYQTVGRQNYLNIKDLEDPLFTSFTFDIDYITSPLFYTLGYSNYKYPNVDTSDIEWALSQMHWNNMEVTDDNGDGIDNGYDILPLLSSNILDDNKLGFGLQQNVYMDKPLYGATEYIYMVDKRNGVNQNDVIFDSNILATTDTDPNSSNSYKLGDSVKSLVNDSDKAWAERLSKNNMDVIEECTTIMKDTEVKHTENHQAMINALQECQTYSTVKINGKEYTEADIIREMEPYKRFFDEFESFKKKIVDWANSKILKYQNDGNDIYNADRHRCIQKIMTFDTISEKNVEKYEAELKKEFTSNFRNGIKSFKSDFVNLYNSVIHNGDTLSPSGAWEGSVWDLNSDDESFLLNKTQGDFQFTIRGKHIVKDFKDELEKFGFNTTLIKSNIPGYCVKVGIGKTAPEWAGVFMSPYIAYFLAEKDWRGHLEVVDEVDDVDGMIQELMSLQCDYETAFDASFTSSLLNEKQKKLDEYEGELENIQFELYGYTGEGSEFNAANPEPGSRYAKYLAAKEAYENDDYSQAQKAMQIAESGRSDINAMLNSYDDLQDYAENNYNAVETGVQPTALNNKTSTVASQTVLDMLGFISGMKKMTTNYPYIIQGITGLDTAYNKHYGIKDPYLGSGDDKITLTCLESLDLRVSSMFNRYFNAIYDRQYRRERVPVNLRRFNCYVYVHDVRNFIPNFRDEITLNRILELTDVYYSVIEFRFYDCEIVPEETGNIFNDISNEAPSEMKRTNFTFTYGNCVVNFIPPSEVVSHNIPTSK